MKPFVMSGRDLAQARIKRREAQEVLPKSTQGYAEELRIKRDECEHAGDYCDCPCCHEPSEET